MPLAHGPIVSSISRRTGPRPGTLASGISFGARGSIGGAIPAYLLFVSPAPRDRLDERALRAVLEHEAAHARHFDPLRLWLAQIGTDLQWPAASARRRFSDWRSALELARDDEACERGVDGSDLAAALIEAAQLGGATRGRTVASLVRETGAGALRERVVRLLYRTDRPPAAPTRARAGWPLVTIVLAIAVAAGVFVGEELVVNLPGLTH